MSLCVIRLPPNIARHRGTKAKQLYTHKYKLIGDHETIEFVVPLFFIDLSLCLTELANASGQLIITAANGALFGVSSFGSSGHVFMLLMLVLISSGTASCCFWSAISKQSTYFSRFACPFVWCSASELSWVEPLILIVSFRFFPSSLFACRWTYYFLSFSILIKRGKGVCWWSLPVVGSLSIRLTESPVVPLNRQLVIRA